jgi:hypothetical protein
MNTGLFYCLALSPFAIFALRAIFALIKGPIG